ncbi:hypothetical protein CMI37_30300 [Candidatus Pacearchaeota archaeon]|nr:hypothetical protein [Candidatus Pacearchaeota archaeon]
MRPGTQGEPAQTQVHPAKPIGGGFRQRPVRCVGLTLVGTWVQVLGDRQKKEAARSCDRTTP